MNETIYYLFLLGIFSAMSISQTIYRKKNGQGFFSFLRRFGRKKKDKKKEKDVAEDGEQGKTNRDND